jgi:hypothetical protein
MKSSIALRVFLLTLCTVGNDSFTPRWSKPFQRRKSTYFNVNVNANDDKDKDDSAPHPPDKPPPDSLLDKSGSYFASSSSFEEEAAAVVKPDLDPAVSLPTPPATNTSNTNTTTIVGASKPTAAELWFRANVVSLQEYKNTVDCLILDYWLVGWLQRETLLI